MFITVNIISQSQQMRAKKKKKSRKRELKNTDAEPKRTLNNKFNKCLSYKLNFISTISFYSLQKWKHCALSRTFYYIYVMNVKKKKKKKLCP